MAVNETIVTGRKWRRCIDVANKLWQRISYWTKASDVEFDDGQTAENKMGAISGITSDLNGESENIAASIKAVNQLNNNLGGFKFGYTSDGKPGYITTDGEGADTVFPFNNISNFKLTKIFTSGWISSGTTRSLEKGKNYLFLFGGASQHTSFSFSPSPTFKGNVCGGAFAVFINNQKTSIKINVTSSVSGDNGKFIMYSFTI